MWQFWVLATLLILLALLFVVEPLVRARRHRLRQEQMNVERREQNIAIFRDRLAELDAERAAGHLDQAQYEALKAELEATLLTDVDVNADETRTMNFQSSRLRWLTVVLVLAVPLISLGLYWKWGAYEGVQQRQLIAEMERSGELPDVEALLTQLETKLEESPDNPEGWFMLGRTRMSLGHYQQAADAFLRLAKLLDAEPQEAASIYGLYAQALYLATQGQFTPEVQSGIKMALDRNPEEINAVGLLGIQAFEQENYEMAARYWEKVLELAPDSPNAEAVRTGIARARAMMAESGETAAQPEQAQSSGDEVAKGEAPVLKVSVALDPALAANANPADTVFIYARAVNGSSMPLAIVRMQVQDLPLTVTLDDSTAMGPMAKLSSAEQVEVIARISKQGTPNPNPGDLQGMVSPVDVVPGSQSLEVLISEQL